MNAMLIHSDLPAQPYTVVLGLGQTGVSSARYLRRQGLNFVLVDTRAEPPGLAKLAKEFDGIPMFLGEVDPELFVAASSVVVSPGLSPNEPAVAAAIAAGSPLRTDIDLFCATAAAPIIGITGSNAKSTVTTLVGLMAKRAGKRVAVGGNLGTPALDLLDDEAELYVLELSSFQLEYSASLPLSTACLLNLTPDHLDWHGTADAYRQAKQKIFSGSKTAVFNRADLLTAPVSSFPQNRVSFGLDSPLEATDFGLISDAAGTEWLAKGSVKLLATENLGMVGRHNVANALAALAIGCAAGLPTTAMIEELYCFAGLAHRGELVATRAGVQWINDSKATNVGATLAALEGLSGSGKVILIAGGQAKGANFTALAGSARRHCRVVILIGEAAAQLESVLRGEVDTVHAMSMSAAVQCAAEASRPGDVVLLSPACASFDMFDGFAARGTAFIHSVGDLGETS